MMGGGWRIHGGVSLGAVTRRTNGGDFRVTESSHTAHAVLPRHAHRSANLTFVVRGDFLEDWDSGTIDCRPGSVVYKRACHPHANRYGSSGADVLHLEPADPLSLAALELSVIFAGFAPLERAMSQELIEIVRGQSVVSARGLFDPLIRCRVPRWLMEIRDQILEQSELPLSLSGMAAEAGVPRVRLSRAFRSHFGCSVGQFVRRVRVERAAQLLSATAQPQAEIAGACGFADQAHLCRVFARQVGCTPGQFRSAQDQGGLEKGLSTRKARKSTPLRVSRVSKSHPTSNMWTRRTKRPFSSPPWMR